MWSHFYWRYHRNDNILIRCWIPVRKVISAFWRIGLQNSAALPYKLNWISIFSGWLSRLSVSQTEYFNFDFLWNQRLPSQTPTIQGFLSLRPPHSSILFSLRTCWVSFPHSDSRDPKDICFSSCWLVCLVSFGPWHLSLSSFSSVQIPGQNDKAKAFKVISKIWNFKSIFCTKWQNRPGSVVKVKN